MSLMRGLAGGPPGLLRKATFITAFGLLMAAAGAGTSWRFQKQTPTAPSARPMFTWSNTGAQIAALSEKGDFTNSGFIISLGSGSFTGPLWVQGAKISTGASVTVSGGDARYVNTKGDTMTGSLALYAPLTVSGAVTISGTTLINPAYSNAYFGVYDDAGKFALRTWPATASLETEGTLSGVTVRAQDTLQSSGTLTVEGNAFINGTLSGKYLTPRYLMAQVFGSGTAVTVGTGLLLLDVPLEMSGFNLTYFYARSNVAGVTGTMRMSLHDLDKGNRSFFSTAPSIDTAENKTTDAAAPPVINAANDDVGGLDRLLFNVTLVHTTAAKGLNILLKFEKP